MTPPWLKPALAYVEQWLGFQMRAMERPGCAIAIAHEGRIVLDTAFGHADAVAGIALTPRHRFRVASHSKSFTAAAVMKLREQKRLRLDDEAGDHVPGLHPDIAQATLTQLLSHSAGVFRDGTDSAYWSIRAPFSNAARIRADLRLPPAIAPNTRFKYSNHGFALLGMVIEAVTGEPYADWVRREIVVPAGLTETTPDMPLPRSARLARGHSGKMLLGRRVIFPGDQPTNALAPATGFVSTAADLVRFFGQLSPNARRSILSVASRREMARPQWRDPYSALATTYGLGTISGRTEGWDWFGHAGGFPGYITRTLVVPDAGLTVSVLTNSVDGMAHPWLDGALNILKAFAQGGPPTRRTSDWTGRWWSLGGAIDLVPIGDKVHVAAPGFFSPLSNVSQLEITGRDTGRIALAGGFGSHGEPARRVRNGAGRVTEVWLAGSRMLPERRVARELMVRFDTPPSD
jgi:CubicO group peptidase (beta-lactamase class C family)